MQNFRSWSPEMVPTGMSCLGLEYFCFEHNPLWTAGDDELVGLAKSEISKIGLVRNFSPETNSPEAVRTKIF